MGHVASIGGRSKVYVTDQDLAAAGNTAELCHTHHVIEYDEGGTPVAVRTLELYREVLGAGVTAYKSNQSITIDNVQYYLTKAVATYRAIVTADTPCTTRTLQSRQTPRHTPRARVI